MAESVYSNTPADQIIGSLYALLYFTQRKRILGFAISGWLKNLPLIFALVAWPFGLNIGWIISGIFLAIFMRMLYSHGKKLGYIRFIPEENQSLPSDVGNIPDNQKVPVRASGTFSVASSETYVRQHPAQYWRVGMGDHVLMVNDSSERFLYQFIQTDNLKVVSGKLCGCRNPDPALEITYFGTWGPETNEISFMFYTREDNTSHTKFRRKIYLAFESQEKRRIVWKSLTGGLDQSNIKEG